MLFIITHGRSGSNLLSSLLSSHPDINSYGEIYGSWYLKKPEILSLYREDSLYPLKNYNSSKVDVSKILYEQLTKEYFELHGLRHLESVKKAIFNSSNKFIHLKRRNKLKQLVSKKLANYSNSHICGVNQSIYDRHKFTLSTKECEREILNIDADEKKIDCLLKFNTIDVFYEDLILGVNEHKKILSFIPLKYSKLKSSLKKQNNRRLSQIITNYSELKTYFRGSYLESMMND
ncbi:hypothetical protein [Ekhidna sp.]|uniref:hypothetical protein n=1 Tax=Ekhidna sp. TaxID=2608089 RepID=UPI003CCBDDDF